MKVLVCRKCLTSFPFGEGTAKNDQGENTGAYEKCPKCGSLEGFMGPHERPDGTVKPLKPQKAEVMKEK